MPLEDWQRLCHPSRLRSPRVNSRVSLILISIWDMNINTQLPRQGVSPGNPQDVEFSGDGGRLASKGQAELCSEPGSRLTSVQPRRMFPEAPSQLWPSWLCLVPENKEKSCVCDRACDTHGKAIAGSADRCQHTPALKLQEDGAILHGAEGIF